MALPFSDTFLQTTGGVVALATYNASWATLIGGWQLPDAVGEVRSTTSGENVARWGGDAPNADHYAEVTTATGWAATGVYLGAAVRAQSGAATAYYAYGNGSAWELIRMVAGTPTIIASGSWTATDGQIIRLEVTGVGGTVTLVLKKAGTTITTFNDTSGSRITTAGYGGIAGYDPAASAPSIAFFTVDNLGAASSDVSGNANIDGPTAGGGMQGGSTVTGNADLGGMSSGGTLATNPATDLSGGATLDGPGAAGGLAGPNDLTGNATLDGPTAAGGAEGGSTLTGGATLDGPAAGGGMSSSATGTLTSGDMKFNNGAVHSNVPFEAFVSVPSTGVLVLRKTGLTSTTSGTAPKCSFADALVIPGTQYRVTWRRTDTGAEGTELLTAT